MTLGWLSTISRSIARENDEGNAYLDNTWIDQILKVGDFFNLYFDALDQRDTAALEELLRPTIHEDEARVSIARNLGMFYRYQVETETSEFRFAICAD